jgi:hypothetical protein
MKPGHRSKHSYTPLQVEPLIQATTHTILPAPAVSTCGGCACRAYRRPSSSWCMISPSPAKKRAMSATSCLSECRLSAGSPWVPHSLSNSPNEIACQSPPPLLVSAIARSAGIEILAGISHNELAIPCQALSEHMQSGPSRRCSMHLVLREFYRIAPCARRPARRRTRPSTRKAP